MTDKGDILLGIDLGTSVLKVCAFDGRDGARLAFAARPLPVDELPGGGREQPVGSVDRAFFRCVETVRESLGRKWRAVRGIGVAAQGGSSIIASRASGRPITRMVLWNDGRTGGHTAELARRHPAGTWRRHTLGSVPPAGLGRLIWLRETNPELFGGDLSGRGQTTGDLLRDATIHIGAGEHLFFALTGVWRQDAGNAIQIGSYHAGKGRLDPGLLDLIGVPLSFVAPLRRGHETSPLGARAARRLGLDAGIPVAGPYLDQEAGYLAAAGAARRPLHVSLGTAWVGNFTLPRGWSGSSPTQLVLPSPSGRKGAGSLVVQPLLAGNRAWDWALETFGGGEPLRAAARAFAKRLLPARELTVLPFITRPNPLDPTAHGGGAVLGLSDRTGPEDMIRAVACGLAFELLRVLEPVRNARVVDRIVLDGGASKGIWFQKLIASLFAPLEVLLAREEDTSVARGALSAFGREVARTRTRRVLPPSQPMWELIWRRYQAYRAAFGAVYGGVRAGRPFAVRGRRRW